VLLIYDRKRNEKPQGDRHLGMATLVIPEDPQDDYVSSPMS
jgi:hypothetical protein